MVNVLGKKSFPPPIGVVVAVFLIQILLNKSRLYKEYLHSRDAATFSNPGASTDVMGIICLLVGIGLTELPNSGKAKAHPAQPLAASLHRCNSESVSVSGLSIFL